MRFLIFGALIYGIYYLIKHVNFGGIAQKAKNKLDPLTCRKCNGQGYWIATRGEKEKCNLCWGSGKMPHKGL